MTPTNGASAEARLAAVEKLLAEFPSRFNAKTAYGMRKEAVRRECLVHRHPKTGSIFAYHLAPEARHPVQEFAGDAHNLADQMVDYPTRWRLASDQEVEELLEDQKRRIEESPLLGLRSEGQGHTVFASPAAVARHIQKKETEKK